MKDFPHIEGDSPSKSLVSPILGVSFFVVFEVIAAVGGGRVVAVYEGEAAALALAISLVLWICVSFAFGLQAALVRRKLAVILNAFGLAALFFGAVWQREGEVYGTREAYLVAAFGMSVVGTVVGFLGYGAFRWASRDSPPGSCDGKKCHRTDRGDDQPTMS